MIRLFFQAVVKFLLGFILVGTLIFLPAGRIFANGILLLVILFVPMFFAGILMLVKSPSLLRKRLNLKEKQPEQKVVVAVSGLMFFVGFLLSGFTVRFGWYLLPKWVSVVASVIFLIGYSLYALVLRENQYVSRTVEIQKNQQVVTTGLYGVVRHPMYAATVLMFLAMPLILGSVVSFFVFFGYPFLIAKRIENEEKLLIAELPGYDIYRETVKYRLIPFLW